MRPNPDSPNAAPPRLACPTALLVALWAVAFGLASAALWEALELIHVVLHHDVVHDGLALVVAIYTMGAIVGLVHGGALAYLGRAQLEQRSDTLREVLAGALLAVPLCGAGLTVGWPVSLSSYAVQAAEWGNWPVPILSWFIVVVTIASAIAAARASLRRTYARWRLGSFGLILGLVALGTLWVGFAMLGQRYSLTPGATLIASGAAAAGVTLWIVLPVVTLSAAAFLRLWSQSMVEVVAEPDQA